MLTTALVVIIFNACFEFSFSQSSKLATSAISPLCGIVTIPAKKVCTDEALRTPSFRRKLLFIESLMKPSYEMRG